MTYNTPRRKRNRLSEITVLDAVVDDFGDIVLARCRYTGELFDASTGIIRGPTIPNVAVAYLDGPNSAKLHAENVALFHENDANCNTCRNLERVKHPKEPSGFLYGRCSSPVGKPSASPYADRTHNGVMIFHPDDPMLMPCYESRWGRADV